MEIYREQRAAYRSIRASHIITCWFMEENDNTNENSTIANIGVFIVFALIVVGVVHGCWNIPDRKSTNA